MKPREREIRRYSKREIEETVRRKRRKRVRD